MPELPEIDLPFVVEDVAPPPIPPEEDATVGYRQAMAMLGKLKPPPGELRLTGDDDAWEWYAPWDRVPRPLKNWLAAARPALDQWRAAARRPRALFLDPREIRWGALDLLAEDLGQARRLLGAAQLEGRRLWTTDKPQDAFPLYLDMLRSADHLYCRPLLMQAMLAVTFAERMYHELHEWSALGGVTPEMLEAALAELRGLRAEAWLPAEALRCEMLLAREEAGRLTPEEAREYAQLDETPSDEDLRRHYRWFRVVLAMLAEQGDVPRRERPPQWVVHEGRVLLIPSESFCARHDLPPIEEIDRAAHPKMAACTLPAVVGAMTAIDRVEGRRNVALAWLALLIHRKRHGRFPETLAAAAEAVDLPPPPDSFDPEGGPLRYRLSRGETIEDPLPASPRLLGHIRAGEPILYSVGPDGVDDGGRLAWSGAFDGRGDWIFLPAIRQVRRPRWRFSLKGLLVLTAVVAALLSLAAPRVRRQQAVAALEAQGALVEYGYDQADAYLWRRTLMELFGRGFVESPWRVDFVSQPTDGVLDLSPIRQLPDLIVLSLAYDELDDDDLMQLAAATEVPRLVIWSPGVTDASLVHIRDFTNLYLLDLSGTRVTSAGVAPLVGERSLGCLLLNQTRVDDALLPAVDHKELTVLELGDTAVTDRGLAALAPMKELAILNLEGTRVTDAGMQHLEGLSELQWLSLNRTNITDAGLRWLGKLSQLDTLHLQQTQIRGPGFESLSKTSSMYMELDLSGTLVDDAGLEYLVRRKLTRLNLADCEIGDAGLELLAWMTELGALDLSGTNITDAGLAHLRHHRYLWGLNVSRTSVTDAGLEYLPPALGVLNVSQTKVTPAAAATIPAASRPWE